MKDWFRDCRSWTIPLKYAGWCLLCMVKVWIPWYWGQIKGWEEIVEFGEDKGKLDPGTAETILEHDT